MIYWNTVFTTCTYMCLSTYVFSNCLSMLFVVLTAVNFSAVLDFTPGTFSVTFDPIGDSEMCVGIPVKDDNITEDVESFEGTIVITTPMPGLLVGSPEMATLTITDDDGEPLQNYSGH